MNLIGFVRERLPRISISLPNREGGNLDVDCIVDTAFDGELSLPSSIVSQVQYYSPSMRGIQLADGEVKKTPYVRVILQWDGETRVVEALVSPTGNALLGMELLEEHLLTVEQREGGEVIIEPF